MILIFANPTETNDIEIRYNATSVMCPGATVPITCDYTVINCCAGSASNSTTTNALWGFVTNIEDWDSGQFIIGFVTIAVTLMAAGIIAGAVFGFKTDFIMFAALIGGLVSIGSVFIQLANIFRSDISTMFTDTARGIYCNNCGVANLMTALIIGPFAFYYFWMVISWWRGQDF